MSSARPGGMKAAYRIAYQRACQEIRQRDPGQICTRAGAILNGRTIRLCFFGDRVEIRVPEKEEEIEFQPEEMPLVEKILVLHYLLGRENKPTKGNMIAFKNLPGASFYDPTYQKRGPRRIARRFGEDVEAFREACSNLHWPQAELGDASCQFDILPKIRGLVVLHAGDEEFPAEVNLLFNDEIVNYLPLEDVAVLAGLIATRLGKSATT
jgi:hypothetical protein